MKAHATIARTIKQSQPFDSLQTEVLLTLLRATERAWERANRPVCETGLSTAQYNVLRILRGSPAGMGTHEVVERLITRAPNITRVVDKLEAKGLIRRRRSRPDRRVVSLRITEPGLALLRELDPLVGESTREAMAGLPQDELEQLCDLLNRLRSPLEAPLQKETRQAG